MVQVPRTVQSANPDPLSAKITGLESGGGALRGETPPAEDHMSRNQGRHEKGIERQRQRIEHAAEMKHGKSRLRRRREF